MRRRPSARPRSGVLSRLLAVALGLGALVPAAVPTPAHAGLDDEPVAVTVADDGTAYVAFRSGGALVRLDARGDELDPLPLDQSGAVDGLAMGAQDSIWVDYGDSTSRLSPDGDLLTHFSRVPAGSCPADDAHDPGRYGGIAVSTTTVYLANRCQHTLQAYTLAGDLLATVALPAGSYPRGVAWGRAVGSRPARVYVALPDLNKVLVYDAATLADDALPKRSISLARPSGGVTPAPAGLDIDTSGQLMVSDLANHAIYVLDATNDYSLYRVLGHPPDPDDYLGALNYPTAFARHAQDGSSYSGDLFIADSRNERVQRWNAYGYTYYATVVEAPSVSVSVPVNQSVPQITGSPLVGERLTCTNGTWSDGPTSFTRGWLRDDALIAGTDAATYVVSAADAGHALTCRVRAGNSAGTSGYATSAPVSVPRNDVAPTNVSLPEVTGSVSLGKRVTCSPGGWSASPTQYTFAWLEDSAVLPGEEEDTLTLGTGDVGAMLACRVTASNSYGTSAPVVSDAVEVTLGDPPSLRARPRITGVATPGARLVCHEGQWTEDPTFGFRWLRDGHLAGRGATYHVRRGDVGHQLRCRVLARTIAGTTTARTAPVRPKAGLPNPCAGPVGVRIDGGDRWTGDSRVQLWIVAPPAAEGVLISTEPRFLAPYATGVSDDCRYPFTLTGNGRDDHPDPVYVRFLETADPERTVKDSILIDTGAPRVRSVTASWVNRRGGWVASVRAHDGASGVGWYRYTFRQGDPGTAAARPADIVSWDKRMLRYVRVYDRAGNASPWVRTKFRR